MNRRRYGGPAPLVLTAFEGTDLPAAVADAFRDGRLTGVFLRRQNLSSLDQARALTGEIRALAGGGLPWIIAIDEEGGLVSHLGHLQAVPPGPMAIAAAGARAREIGRRAGRALRRLGINTVFAPVCDVNTAPSNPVIGSRSFGDEPAAVSRLAAEIIEGYRDASVLTTAKHFPGHGMTEGDSHAVLPLVAVEEGALAGHLRPFRSAVTAGADLVMTAHVAYPALEVAVAARAGVDPPREARPATLSPLLLRRLLREEIGFAGPVVSDAFDMAGLTGAGSPQQVAEAGTAAGVDLWLLTPGLEALEAVERGIARVASDPGGRFLVQQAGARVNRARLRIAAAGPPDGDAVDDETPRVYEEVAARAIALVRAGGRLPLAARRPLFIFPEGWPPHLVVDRAAVEAEVLALWPEVRVRWTGLDPEAADVEALRGAEADALVVGTLNRGPMRAGQRALLEAAGARSEPLVAVALLDPYDVAAFPVRAVAIATFGARAENMRALLAVLAGRAPAGGRMPVRV